MEKFKHGNTLKSASFYTIAITHKLISITQIALGPAKKNQFMHNNENGTVGFDTPALYLLCFDALKNYIHIDFAPKDPLKGTHLRLPIFWYVDELKLCNHTQKYVFPYWPSTIFPRQVLMKEEAGMALLWRDLEAHSVAGFAHRTAIGVAPAVVHHFFRSCWRYFLEAGWSSIIFFKVTTRLAITAVVSSINIELLQRLWMSMANHTSACGRIIMDYPLISPTG